jgi:hypothetical protein
MNQKRVTKIMFGLGLGLALVASYGVSLNSNTHRVHAAVRVARATTHETPGPGAQIASPADARVSDGALPPNFDWSLLLPAGDGQFQTSIYCASCHTLKVTATRRSDATGWDGIVRRMISAHNAPIQADDAAVITKYLTDELAPTAPTLSLPLQINTVPKETLHLMGLLSADDVQKILDARAKAKIKDVAELQALIGVKKATKYKPVLSFE